MNQFVRKIVSIVLIVTLIFTNAGVNVFAESTEESNVESQGVGAKHREPDENVGRCCTCERSL